MPRSRLVDADGSGRPPSDDQEAIYSMVERGQLPGIVRIGRRVLVREDALLDWLRQKSTPSLEGR
jgi:excisionase family DNA binding protein